MSILFDTFVCSLDIFSTRFNDIPACTHEYGFIATLLYYMRRSDYFFFFLSLLATGDDNKIITKNTRIIPVIIIIITVIRLVNRRTTSVLYLSRTAFSPVPLFSYRGNHTPQFPFDNIVDLKQIFFNIIRSPW